jgi:3-deoxy-D-manno-octulosonic acid (KDO) 8-phosphate synthase
MTLSATRVFSICRTGAEAERCRDTTVIFDCFDWRVSTNGVAQTELPEMLFSLFPAAGAVVATERHVEIASLLADFLYIPGEICRQGDVLEAAAKTGKRVFVERGAFLAPPDMLRALEKLSGTDVVAVECGSSFGYSDRVLDPRALAMVRDAGSPLALQVSELLEPRGERYRWRSNWPIDVRFVEAYVNTAKAFGVASFICDESRHPGLAFDLQATLS